MGVRGASPSVERRLDGDGGAGRAANRQEVSVTGLLGVVPQHFGQVTYETAKTLDDATLDIAALQHRLHHTCSTRVLRPYNLISLHS